jgi:hypothetical protein
MNGDNTLHNKFVLSSDLFMYQLMLHVMYSFRFKIYDVLAFYNRYVSRCFLVCRFIHFAFNLHTKRYLDTCMSEKAKTSYILEQREN